MTAIDFRAGRAGLLLSGEAALLARHLEAGNVCLLPSDSSYSLAGLPTVSGVTTDIDEMLLRNGQPLSLAFGSLRLIGAYASLSPKAERFFGLLAPGPITFVAPATSRATAGLSRSRLLASGTIGVRITESHIEAQLSNELGLPVTTTPVRDEAGVPIVGHEAALRRTLELRSQTGSRRRLAVVRSTVPRPGQVSTVVEEYDDRGMSHLRIIRQGALVRADIERAARVCRYSGVDYENAPRTD